VFVIQVEQFLSLLDNLTLDFTGTFLRGAPIFHHVLDDKLVIAGMLWVGDQMLINVVMAQVTHKPLAEHLLLLLVIAFIHKIAQTGEMIFQLLSSLILLIVGMGNLVIR